MLLDSATLTRVNVRSYADIMYARLARTGLYYRSLS
jgi:hypothetical protein